MIYYRKATVKGLQIFYRESGSPGAPVLLLLHGFPSSSRMFQTLLPLLADCYHVIAPDYPGFGYSDAPSANMFHYTFEHIAQIIEAFTDSLCLYKYSLYLQDYGGPVGFRLAQKQPGKIQSIIIQNAVIHEEGLSALWELRKEYWKDHRTNEAALRESLHSIEAAKQRHLYLQPYSDKIDPDIWMDEFTFLQRPEQEQIQLDLFYDYRTNVALYPVWQQWLHNHRLPLLVVWGALDPLFTVEGAQAFKKEVPDAEVHLLEAGHFALDLVPEKIAQIIKRFLKENLLSRHE